MTGRVTDGRGQGLRTIGDLAAVPGQRRVVGRGARGEHRVADAQGERVGGADVILGPDIAPEGAAHGGALGGRGDEHAHVGGLELGDECVAAAPAVRGLSGTHGRVRRRERRAGHVCDACRARRHFADEGLCVGEVCRVHEGSAVGRQLGDEVRAPRTLRRRQRAHLRKVARVRDAGDVDVRRCVEREAGRFVVTIAAEVGREHQRRARRIEPRVKLTSAFHRR